MPASREAVDGGGDVAADNSSRKELERTPYRSTSKSPMQFDQVSMLSRLSLKSGTGGTHNVLSQGLQNVSVYMGSHHSSESNHSATLAVE